ncbi:MAG TPA: DHHA1 domain-containing protein [Halococcus sp.]|nr:DHHA1 domain-containing protein [Halococcus sp.]
MNKLLGLVSGIALVGTSLYWQRRERTVKTSLTVSRDWEANTNNTNDGEREAQRAAREAAAHLDARVRDLPERVSALDEERRDLRRELDSVREHWADSWWTAHAGETNTAGDPPVFVVEFDHGELPDARAFAKRAMDEDVITLVAAHGDGSFAVAVGQALSETFSAEDIAREIANEAGGGAGGNERLAVGGGATGALSAGCRHVREQLTQSGMVRIE